MLLGKGTKTRATDISLNFDSSFTTCVTLSGSFNHFDEWFSLISEDNKNYEFEFLLKFSELVM